MIKSFLGLSVAALLLAPAVPAQLVSSGPVGSGQSLLVGSMSGAWNTPLPPAASPGFATGVMSLGTPQFLFDAELLLAPSPQGSGVQGTLDGTLQAFPLSPQADVFAVVTGSWTYDPATESGKYRGLIVTPPLPFPVEVPQILIGQMRGTFQDAYTPGGPDQLGSFSGKWVFNVLTATPPTPAGDPYPGPTPGDD